MLDLNLFFDFENILQLCKFETYILIFNKQELIQNQALNINKLIFLNQVFLGSVQNTIINLRIIFIFYCI